MASGKVKDDSRIGIIETVQTPLGFFALVVLVVEAILGVTAGLVTSVPAAAVVTAMIVLIFLLVLIVAFFAYRRPEALHGRRAETVLERPAQSTPIPPAVEHVNKPSVLCVSTEEFATLGADTDATVLKQYFSRRTTVRHAVTLAQFRTMLTEGRYDILHLLCFVDPTEGSLRFGADERLSSEGLASLISVCGARLLVLATCDSVVLAAKIAHVANMVAATTSVSVDSFVAWERCFYGLLSQGHSVSKAYEVARSTTDAPMVLLLKREIAFTSERADA
jgi:hypothetical protein